MVAGVTRKPLKMIHDDVEYYQHQLDGIRKMANMGSFLLADEMGLGKSLQALTVAAIDFERDWAKRVLVVAPASLKWNWYDECGKFSNFRATILDGDPKTRERQIAEFETFGYEVLICNYEQVKVHLKRFNALRFDIAIFDEAHYLKNHKSQRTEACLKLRAKRNFLLTGSPLLNQVDELWSLLHKIDPQRWPNYWQFVNRYAVKGGYQGKQVVGTRNRTELTMNLNEVMVRRLKKDCLNLPDKQYIEVKVDLSPLQRELYQQAAEDLEIDLPYNPTPMEIENSLVKYLRLKQICGTTACIEGYEDDSAKLDAVMELITPVLKDEPDSPAEPIVVFTQFRKVQECFVERCKKAKITVFELNGDTPKQERSEIVKTWGQFRDKDGKPAVLCAMLQVAGVGLNMTQASKCVFIDKLYVPKLNEQAEDRIHRIGANETKPIQIYQIIARKTIEARIEAILRRKRKLFDSLVEDNNWKKELYNALMYEQEDE